MVVSCLGGGGGGQNDSGGGGRMIQIKLYF